MTLFAFAAERHAVAPCCGAVAAGAVDRYVLHTGRSAANPPHAAEAVERWNRRKD